MSLADLAGRGELVTAGDAAQVNHGPAPIGDNDARVVARLLEQLKLVFPAWKRAFPTADAEKRAGMEWTRALVDANCTSRDQLARGMQQARMQDIPFFPSPGRFIKWCELTPESLGLPSMEQAFEDAARRRNSHPAVTLAARATRFEAQTLTADEYRPVFEQAYMQLVRRAMGGEDLEAEILKALPTRDQINHSPELYREIGLKHIASLKRLIVGKPGSNTNRGSKL